MPTNKSSPFKNCNNLTKIKNEELTYIVFMQKPYNINNIVVGIPRYCTVFTSGS